MATKPDVSKSDANSAEKSGKAGGSSKKLFLIIGLVVLILALAGGGWLYLSKKNAYDDGTEEATHVAPKGPPIYLALDNMVVNLADPGGSKVAQVGITLELSDAQAPDKVKIYTPSIRSSILLLISQRTSTELLLLEGKEKLASDILAEAARPFEVHEGKKKDKGAEENPVRGVLFSSFIIQ